MTATVVPGCTLAVLSAAPTPVVTPQPMSASCSSGRSVSTFTIEPSLHVICSAKVPSPVIAMYWLPSGRLPRIDIMTANSLSHRCDESCRQNQHVPHAGMNDAMIRSPALTFVTSAPTSSTLPAPSWPRIGAGHEADVAVLEGEVGVADATGAELDDDVARAGCGGLEVLDGEGSPGLGEQCGPHGGLLVRVRVPRTLQRSGQCRRGRSGAPNTIGQCNRSCTSVRRGRSPRRRSSPRTTSRRANGRPNGRSPTSSRGSSTAISTPAWCRSRT